MEGLPTENPILMNGWELRVPPILGNLHINAMKCPHYELLYSICIEIHGHQRSATAEGQAFGWREFEGGAGTACLMKVGCVSLGLKPGHLDEHNKKAWLTYVDMVSENTWFWSFCVHQCPISSS